MESDFALRNVDQNELKRWMDGHLAHETPEPDCTLIKRDPNYYGKLANGQVERVMKEPIQQSLILFDAHITLPPTTIFGEILHLCEINNIRTADFVASRQFDITYLPDTPYLLKVIYSIDANSPIIRCLPRKADQIPAEFNQALLEMALRNMREAGEVRNLAAVNFSAINGHVQQIANAAKAYTLLKFGYQEFVDRMNHVLSELGGNSTMRYLFDDLRVAERLAAGNGLGLTPQSAAVVQDSIRRIRNN